jgi:hypothetical protein
LDGCNKVSTFVSRLNKQSNQYPDRYSPEKYRGDGLELFAEALLKLHPVDNRLGIGSYEPLAKDDVDTGVDGTGVGINGKPATVQVKYRSDNRLQLTANEDHLTNFAFASQNKYGVDINDVNNMLVITTAESLNSFTNGEMLLGKVRCVGYKQLRELVDNNVLFWDSFRKLCS